MNRLKIISIILIISSIGTISTVQAVPTNMENIDRYYTLGIRHDERPNACLFEPDLSLVDTQYWKNVEFQTWSALLEWQIQMSSFTDGDWTMYIHSSVPYSEHYNKTPDEYRHCDIFITYEYENKDVNSKSLAVTGIDFSHSKHKYTFITMYLYHLDKTKIILSADDGIKQKDGTINFEIEITKKPLPLNQVYNIALHEIGHGLGLGHYQVNNKFERSAMTPQLEPFNEEIIFDISLADKFMLTQIYGTDGYSKPQPIILPDACYFIDEGKKSGWCD